MWQYWWPVPLYLCRISSDDHLPCGSFSAYNRYIMGHIQYSSFRLLSASSGRTDDGNLSRLVWPKPYAVTIVHHRHKRSCMSAGAHCEHVNHVSHSCRMCCWLPPYVWWILDWCFLKGWFIAWLCTANLHNYPFSHFIDYPAKGRSEAA